MSSSSRCQICGEIHPLSEKPLPPTGQNFRLGWRRSKAGKKFHFYNQEGKPLCGRVMKNVFLEGENPGDRLCKRCQKIREGL